MVLMTGEEYVVSLKKRGPPTIYLLGEKIENLTLGRAAVGYLVESMHGAGSPQAQRIMIHRISNIEEKKKLAKSLAQVLDDKQT